MSKIKNSYQILILLTGGEINDMPQTKDELVKLSAYPCSVIIIGVGAANFSSMTELDGDDGLLCDSRDTPAERDIVQFVEFKEAMKWGNLEELVLKEIPDQVCEYMYKKGALSEALDQEMARYNEETNQSNHIADRSHISLISHGKKAEQIEFSAKLTTIDKLNDGEL